MKKDRLRHDADDIENLDDLIEARDEHASHFSGDRDSLEQDIEVPEDVDVEEALTFPHPKHKKPEDIELMSTRHPDDMDETRDSQDIQPSDYEHNYEEAIDTYADDDEDPVFQKKVHEAGIVEPEDLTSRPETDLPEKHWRPDEETGA